VKNMKAKEEVKVYRIPRPKFECASCNKTFPSSLDLEEHRKYDHAATTSAPVAG
jgi:hypothetical protein